MNRLLVAIILISLQQCTQFADAVTCASNPCKLVQGSFDEANGYCCYDVPPNYADSICTCPNNVAPVLNAPCRNVATANQFNCSRTCVNGGVCNIVNGQQVCWCTLGYSGSFCEIQGTSGRCAANSCVSGTCVEQTIGASTYAYCHCAPGWTGVRCDQCYFTCTQVGAFPDTAYCSVGRYFYCAQATGAPVSALCRTGERFNRATNQCDPSYNCT